MSYSQGVASGGGERLEAALVGVGVAGGVGARALDLAVLAGGPVVVANLFAVRAGDDRAAALNFFPSTLL